MAIEQDGRWYVSPEYTMLEMARQIVGAPKPDFPTRTVGGGVASPGELVDEMWDGLCSSVALRDRYLLPAV